MFEISIIKFKTMTKVLFLTLALVAVTLQGHSQVKQCSTGQLPFQGVCKPIYYVDGCALYQADNTCQACEYGFALKQGKCQTNSNQTADCCASYSSDGTCLQCSNGLYSSAPYCLRNEITGCILKQANGCAVCGYGLALINGHCITPVAKCSAYDQNGICSACSPNQKLIQNYCYTFPQLPNCQSNNEYGCIQCDTDYYLTAKRTCQQFEPGCLMYNREKCTACLPKFTLRNNKCIISACQVYSQQGCTQCQTGFTLVAGLCEVNGCVKVVNNNCVQCRDELRLTAQGCVAPADYQCQSCAQGFSFINGQCLKVIFGCLSYTSSNKCAQCQSPFQLTINGECQIMGCQTYCQSGCQQCYPPFTLNNNLCSISYCSTYANNGCSSCNSGYQLVNGQCFQTDPNCINYDMVNNAPICTQCIQQYYLCQGICKPAQKGCLYDGEGNCNSCKPNFSMKSQGQCEMVGCSEYNWETCLTCASPFEFNAASGTCVISYCTKYGWSGCSQCEKGWLLNNGVCLRGDPYCISYSQQGTCQACQSGFFLSGTQCTKNIPHCALFSQDNLSCLECQTGYSLYQFFCKKVIPNCQKMNYNDQTCACCNAGYHLINGECTQKDPNCLTYSFQQNQVITEYCSECKTGFYYDASLIQCRPNSYGCVYNGPECVSCIQPFKFNAGSCYIAGCQTYCQTGCVNCAAPFSLDANKDCFIAHCSAYSSQGCQQCSSGFTLTRGGLCVEINPNCLAYEGIQCVQCKDGFSLVGSNCVIQDPNCQSYSQDGVICNVCITQYHPDCQGKCQIDQPGCIYSRGICTSCNPPFTHNYASKKCELANCQQADSQGCIKCFSPFSLNVAKQCKLDSCVRWDSNGCKVCKPQYHLTSKICLPDNPNCQFYSALGVCELCRGKFVMSSNGECIEGSNACVDVCPTDQSKCLGCNTGYFLNRFYQCEKEDGRCQAYTNGVCSKCQDKFFLFSDICFPYTAGCVQYSGKDCTICKTNFVLKNGECFNWSPQGMALLGGADHYNFDINPIDVRQSKYYINNLSPASAIGKFYYSSFFDKSFQDCSLSTLEGQVSKGWKAKVSDSNQYVGVILSNQPATFYAVQLEAVDTNYITEFYLEYSVDGVEFIKVQNSFAVPADITTNMTTIYFTGIYCRSIRIRITGYQGVPACHVDFFYYDMLRFRKISNLKSLTYLQETISSNFVDRVDNQIFINQVYFFNPSAECSIKEMCFTGLQLCQPRDITGLTLTFSDANNYVTEFYLTYSVDGRRYNCYKNCQTIKIDKCNNNTFNLKIDQLRAQGVRVYPKNFKGTPKFSPTFFYN